jgi:uncharacterized transporter YbjL
MSKSVKVVFQIDQHRRWFANGPRVDVDSQSLRATRLRARKVVQETYGANAKVEEDLRIPATAQAMIERAKKLRIETQAQKDALDAKTDAFMVQVAEMLRRDLSFSYEDAAELLDINVSVLKRKVHSGERLKQTQDLEDET